MRPFPPSPLSPPKAGRRVLTSLLSLLALAGLLVACGSPQAGGDSPAKKAGGPQVITTFLPITLLTRAVAGECAEVRALVPPAMGPHDFQANPGDLMALNRARVLVKNGLGVESFLDRLIAAATNPKLLVIDSSQGVRTIGANPHIWLDPLRAAQQVATIRDGLVKADPGCAEGYRRRAAATTAQLKALNGELARLLAPHRGQTFVAFHDVAPYFAERYGLRAVFLVDVPELNPTPADLRRVSEEVRRSRPRALLSEPQEGGRAFSALAEDLGLRLSVFDPMETGGAAASREVSTYFEVMRRNGANLVAAFGG